MAKKVLIGLVVVVLAFVGFVYLQPTKYAVERSGVVPATPDVAYGLVADFHKWDGWSPWAKLDPNQKTEHSGAAAGVGAVYFWSGNDKVGEGRMTITEAKPGELVRIKLEFIKPWASTNDTSFAFAKEGEGTRVTWRMEGNNEAFMERVMSVFMNMDKMIGPDFEKGLASMKTVAEDEAKKAAAARAEAEKKAAETAAAPTDAADAGTATP